MCVSAEHDRLHEAGTSWKRWGPYLSARAWGTVREDYSANGDAWNYFPHDHARSRAYRWNEDGLAGISDDKGHMCFALALWNGRDPILKERLFGLTNPEGNHGEDVKEQYYYLDATPTHSWMQMCYRYPQAAYPYALLVAENARRTRSDPEYELADTGVMDDHRFFAVLVEYAKASPDDMLVRISITNRGPDPASIDVLPTLWFRNTWDWGDANPRPGLRADGPQQIRATHALLGEYTFTCDGQPTLLFTENETNQQRLYGVPNRQPYVKDAFHRWLIEGDHSAVNPAGTGTGTKAAAHYHIDLAAGATEVIRMRLCAVPPAPHLSAAPAPADQRGEPPCQPDDTARHQPAAPHHRISSPISTSSVQHVSAKPMPSMPPCCPPVPARWNGRCFVKRWPGCSGASSSTITMCAAGSRATPPSRHRRPNGSMAVTTPGHICTTSGLCQCPIPGNTRGMPRGILRFTV